MGTVPERGAARGNLMGTEREYQHVPERRSEPTRSERSVTLGGELSAPRRAPQWRGRPARSPANASVQPHRGKRSVGEFARLLLLAGATTTNLATLGLNNNFFT